MNKTIVHQILRLSLLGICCFGLYMLISWSYHYLLPFIIALLCAILLNPFVSWIERTFKMPRGLSAFLTIGIFILAVSSIAFILIIELIEGSLYLSDHLPNKIETLTTYLTQIFESYILPLYENILYYFNMLNENQQQNIIGYLMPLISSLSTTIGDSLQFVFSQIPKMLLLLPTSITMIIFISLGTFFILVDWHRLTMILHRFSPNSLIEDLKLVTHHLKKAFNGYIKAQFILILITGLIIFIGLFILKVEHALTISILAIAIDLLPYIGTGLIFIPWIFYLFITGQYEITIGLAILYGVLVITRQIIEPKILSASIGIQPLTMLFVLFISIQIWGVFGVILAPIIVVLIQALNQAGVFKRVLNFIKSG